MCGPWLVPALFSKGDLGAPLYSCVPMALDISSCVHSKKCLVLMLSALALAVSLAVCCCHSTVVLCFSSNLILQYAVGSFDMSAKVSC